MLLPQLRNDTHFACKAGIEHRGSTSSSWRKESWEKKAIGGVGGLGFRENWVWHFCSMEKMMFAAVLVVVLLVGHVHMGVSSEAEAPPVVDVPSEVDVVVLDASNFTQTIEENAFVLVEFYAPWCGHCKRLAPEYAKAATELKSHDHPKIILAKVDANDEQNKKLASLHGVQGFPTLKVFRDGGESVRHYNGPRDAQGIVAYLKQMAGPPSHLLSSLEEAEIIVKENPLTVVGVFNDLENTECQEFLSVADELRSEYNFTHTFDTSYVPKTGVDLSAPAVRLYKDFDEGFNDASDLSPDGLKSFLDAKGVPLVVEMNKDPANHAALVKFFNGVGTKVFLFLDLKGEGADEYQTAYHNLAKAPHPKVLKFLIADAAENENALKFFGIKEDKVPAIVVQGESNGEQYLALDIKVSELDHWLQDCLDGKLEPHVKSDEIPETNDEPVKVVVRKSLNDMVLESGKNVLLEFYAPWCGHCKKLAPTLEELAIDFKDDDKVVIAKFDATTNDVPRKIFEVKGFPTLYLHTANGENILYKGDRSKADLADFVNKHRSDTSDDASPELSAVASSEEASRDEL